MVHGRYLMAPSPIPKFDNPKMHMNPALQLFGAGREKRIYAVPPYTRVESLAFDGAEVLSLEEARQIYDLMTRYPDFRLYVAEIDGRIVGTFTLIVMENLAHGGARSGLVESVVVAPGMRR